MAAIRATSTAGLAAAQQEANYINRNIDLVAQKYHQRSRLLNAAARAEQQAAMDAARYEAEQINAGMIAREAAIKRNIAQTNARYAAEQAAAEKNMQAEAQFMNQSVNARQDKARAEAEYINRNSDLSYAAMRREADLENQNFDLRARRAAQSSEGGFLANLARPQMIRHGVAEIDSLMRGQRGQAMASIGAAMRDAGLGAAALTTSMTGLVVLMGSAALLRGAEAMGKWATETRAAASAAGMGIESYSQLQGALTLTGMKADSANATLRRLAVNLSTALANPASQAAEAFHNLGISQEDLTKNGQNVSGALDLLSNAFVRTADGANKSAAMSAIFGRGFQEIIPALQNGSMSLDELKEKAQALGLTLTEDTAAKLERTGNEVRTLGDTIKGDAIVAFEKWGPVIEKVTGLLGALLDVLLKVTGAAGGALSAAMGVVAAGDAATPAFANTPHPSDRDRHMAGLPPEALAVPGSGILGSEMAEAGPKAVVPPMTKGGGGSAMDTIRNQMALAQASASGGGSHVAETQAEIKVLKDALATQQLTDKEREQLSTELANKTTQLNNEMTSAGGKAAKQSYEDFASAERLKIGEAEGSSSKIKAIYDEWINAAITKYKQLGSVVDELRAKELEAVNAAKRGEIKTAVSSDEQQATLARLNAELAQYQSGGVNRPSKTSGPQQDMRESAADVAQAQQIAATSQAEIAALRAAGATAQETLGIEMQAKQQEVALYEKAAQASEEAAKKIAAPFISLADNIGSTLEGGMKDLFKDVFFPQVDLLKQGLTTIKVSERGTELRSLFQKVFTSLASDFGNAMESAIGHVVAQALSGGASNTIGELLGNLMSKAFTSITGNIFGTAIGQTAGSAVGGAASSAVGSTAVVTAISTAATAQVTGFGTVMGTATSALVTAIAANATAITGAISVSTGAEVIATDVGHPSFLGFSAAKGAVIPSFGAGGLVGGGSLSILHPREMVLPAHISEGIQRMFGGVGHGSVNNASLNYAPTINTGSRGRGGTGMTRSEFSQMLSLNSGAMLGQARSMMNSGWRPA
jgi:hypothetical protein